MSTLDPLLGRTLDGKYRIEGIIGRGGMGAVYRATHIGTGRVVAVKVILPQLVQDPEALERFRREARASGGLRHPNIVDVTDFGTARVDETDVAYLVMEFLHGKTVRDTLKEQGRLPLAVVVDIVEQIALALDEAHRNGIVHRDLKPDNVWLVPDPRGGHAVRVLDFGLAKLLDPAAPDTASHLPTAFAPARTPAAEDDEETIASSGGGSRDSNTLTTAGSTLGTPAYMSPEQCRGGEIDFQSDLYSLGIMAWEAIAGRRPFDGSLNELVRKHLQETPMRLDEALPGVPAAVAGAVARALSKRPADRHPSARAMAGSLRVGAEGAGVIIRRAISLYSERFGSFLALSAHLSWPGLLVLIAIAIILAAAGFRTWMLMLPIVCMTAWGLVTAMTHAGFALAIDRLRTKPLEDLRPGDLLDDMRRRLSLPPEAGRFRLLGRLLAFYMRCEFKAEKAGTGDLAFFVAFLERTPVGETRERVSRLAAVTRKSYDWIRGAIFASLILIPFVEGTSLFSVARIFLPAKLSTIIAIASAVLLIPVNAVLINPVFSSALAMLYFRARQANGEDVALSAILPTRL
jgi:eukaryotic-like serine/threonine-protein kinase